MKSDSSGREKRSSTPAGVQAVADMMNVMDPAERDRLMREISAREPGLAHEIEQKMLTFEDLAALEPRELQLLLQHVPRSKWVLAMRKVTEEFKQAILKAFSGRAGAILLEEVQQLGPQRVSDVEAAQREIAQVARTLRQEDKIHVDLKRRPPLEKPE